MGKVKIGIIGAGRIGEIHAKNIVTMIKNAELLAVADSFEDRAKEFARKYEVPQCFNDYTVMLENTEIDAVLICSNTSGHKEAIIKAAEQGKAIFCEKPIALSMEETDEALAVVEKNKVLMQVAFMRRFDPAIFAAKQEIQKGTIGEPLVMRSISRDPEGPSLDYVGLSGGFFVDSSIHDIDLSRWFMDSEIEKVYAEGKTLIYPQYKKHGDADVAFTTLSFTNGKIGSIENSRRSGYGYDTRLEISGTDGTLQIGYLRNTNFKILNKAGSIHDIVPSWQERFTDAFVNEMNHFVECVIEGKTPLITGYDAKKALSVALAATKSYKTGTAVAVSDY